MLICRLERMNFLKKGNEFRVKFRKQALIKCTQPTMENREGVRLYEHPCVADLLTGISSLIKQKTKIPAC
jgi:hypothetical protein